MVYRLYLWCKLVKGAVAGAVSVWMMDMDTSHMYKAEDPELQQRVKEVQIKRRYMAHVAAGKTVDILKLDLSFKQQHYAETGINCFAGGTPKALYGVLDKPELPNPLIR